jgi:uncharacterized membrane protein
MKNESSFCTTPITTLLGKTKDRKKKDLIMQHVVFTKTMPQNNKTNITPEERDLIRCWIEQGANVK